jgi:hypothetical protein
MAFLSMRSASCTMLARSVGKFVCDGLHASVQNAIMLKTLRRVNLGRWREYSRDIGFTTW